MEKLITITIIKYIHTHTRIYMTQDQKKDKFFTSCQFNPNYIRLLICNKRKRLISLQLKIQKMIPSYSLYIVAVCMSACECECVYECIYKVNEEEIGQ